MTNGFALNHDKSLQIYFFYIMRQAKNDFLKDVESTVDKSVTMSTKGDNLCDFLFGLLQCMPVPFWKGSIL